MKEGIITRGIGGFYHVVLDEGGEVTCRPRGRLRKGDMRPLTGDRVRVRLAFPGGSEGVIEEILPRRSQLTRPPIANVDMVVVVMAAAEPDPDRYYLDRLLVAIFAQGLPAMLCLNKADLVPEEEARAWVAPYEKVVEKTFVVSARLGWGLEPLVAALRGRISTLAGPSGAGKSALLNGIYPGYARQTGDVSRKLGRGRHTTRAVELLPLPNGDGGWVADTPGFSQIDLSSVDPDALDRLFPDFTPFSADCRFPGCRHLQEPDCRVREGVAAEVIAPWRYHHYKQIFAELKDLQARQYR